jgi:acetyltransferase-like isoleucine patch superfamily enzyme
MKVLRKYFELRKVLWESLTSVVSKSRRWNYLVKSGLVVVGKHSYGLPNVYQWGDETRLIIGNYCSIAEGVVILLGGGHRLDWVSTYPFSVFQETWGDGAKIKGHPTSKGDVVIGNDVWVGHGALILSGVTIGDGAVIGAGSVVSKSVPEFAIVAGNPAIVIRNRFPQETIDKIKESRWWDLDDEAIKNRLDKLMAPPEF